MKLGNTVLAAGLCALAFEPGSTLEPCEYTIPEYNGVPCNQLPPPPPAPDAVGDCQYYWCDENTPCGSGDPNLWQRKIRKRLIYRDGIPPQYYQVMHSDTNSQCCKCQD